jgi:tRNA pseudouridine38-40 synthase
MNFKLTIQYEGTDFHGWQIQAGKRTVQGELTRVLTLLEGQKVVVHGSGRTDAGVHAEGQIANVHLERSFTPLKLQAAINGNLSQDMRIVRVSEVADSFHARFSAKGKTYLYRVLSGKVMPPFWRRFALHEARELDLEKMRHASSLFLGKHDWVAFSSAQSDVTSRVRTVTQLEIKSSFDARVNCNLIEISASADGFLRYMVRSIVGTLLAVGRGELNIEEVRNAIESGQRPPAVTTAPAHGLTLINVKYEGRT